MSSFPVPDHMFDGGDLDCGSGLVLLIRENMLKTPIGGVLEMRSREATVADDLPPWCRMVGHDYLGNTSGDNCTRYFIRRGAAKAMEEEKALAEDKKQAREYEWRLRIRATGHLKSTVYCRNFSWDSGQPASFEEKDVHPCGVEQLFGALGASLCSGYATECAKSGLEMDDIEITVRGKLNNVLAHLGLEDGDPSVSSIDVKCFASTMDDAAAAEAAWKRTVALSPVAATLAKGVTLNIKFAVV